MPVPEGEITTTEILQTEVDLAEELLAADDEVLVQVIEEISDDPEDTEQV
jgi:hypothetical protein